MNQIVILNTKLYLEMVRYVIIIDDLMLKHWAILVIEGIYFVCVLLAYKYHTCVAHDLEKQMKITIFF